MTGALITRRASLAAMAGALASAGLPAASRADSPQCRTVPASPSSLPPLMDAPLGTLAGGKGLVLGVQVDQPYDGAYGQDLYDPVYRELIEREKIGYLAYGTSFGFGPICPDPPGADGSLAFTNRKYNVADTWFLANDITDLARAAGLRGRAEALVWNDAVNCPRWLKALPAAEPNDRPGPELTSNLAFMRKYVSAAFKKILQLQAGNPEFFFAVGVVNEPIVSFGARSVFRDGPFHPRDVPVIGLQGVPHYIREAFREADAANRRWAERLGVPVSRAKLFLNETECETDQFGPLQRPALIALLEAMLKERLPISAVGLECHLQPQMMADPLRPDWTAFRTFIDAVGALGLEVYITELDVLDYQASCAGAAASARASDELTKLYFGSFFDRVLQCKAVKSICFWDLSDRYSFYRRLDVSSWYGYDRLSRWLPGRSWPKCATLPADRTAIACPRPAPYDENYAAKPARAAIADAIRAAPTR